MIEIGSLAANVWMWAVIVGVVGVGAYGVYLAVSRKK